MSTTTVKTGEEKLEDRLEKLVEKVNTMEKQIKKLVDTLGVVDARLKKVNFLHDINYSG